MTIKFGSINVENCGGDVFRVNGDIALEVGSVNAKGVGGSFFNDSRQSILLEGIGLPPDTDINEVVELSNSLKDSPSDQHEAIVQSHPLYVKFASGAMSAAQFAANLASIASSIIK